MDKIIIQALQLFEGGIAVEEIKKIMSLLFSKHNEEKIKITVEKSIEMYCSLQKAMNESGGSGWNLTALYDMTVINLISTLGVNNIRFVHNKKKDKLEIFIRDMLNEYTKHLEINPNNLVAATAVDIYKKMLEYI